MKAKVALLWFLATLWFCIEAAFQAMNRSLTAPSDAQMALAMEHLREAMWAVGPKFAAWMMAGLLLWFVQGVVGVALTVWAVVEAYRFIKDHARKQREALAASRVNP